MANSMLKLTGKFESGKKYLLDGALLKAWQDALLADRIIPGQGLTETGTPLGRILNSGPGGGTAAAPATGAFFGLFTEGGATYLQGGGVSGGAGGSATIASELVIAAGATRPLASAGATLYLRASCRAVVEDGVMLPGCELLSATLTTSGGDNHEFTVSSQTGNLYYVIGTWNSDTFLPSGSGNLSANGCPGSFSLSRT